MQKSLKIGLSFGLTSGVITTLGLMVGLATTTQSKLAVIGGVLTIALVDALSDSLGIHISQESQENVTGKNLWLSTLSTFIGKFATAVTFVIPLLYLTLFNAVIVSIVWGLLLLGILSFFIAKSRNETPSKIILEHIIVGIVVIGLSAALGNFISKYFS